MRWFVVLAVMLAACSEGVDGSLPVGDEFPASTPETTEDAAGCADVVDVEIERDSDGAMAFHVTVSSADEGWDKYADEWEVRDSAGNVLGTRTLTHPHVDEQPFTRSLTGVSIPDGISRVVVAARDSVLGYCGDFLTVNLP